MSETAGGPGKPGRKASNPGRGLTEEAVIRSFRITAADGKLVFIDTSHDNEAGKDQTFMELGYD